MGVDSGLPDFRGKDGFWRASGSWRSTAAFVDARADAYFARDDHILEVCAGNGRAIDMCAAGVRNPAAAVEPHVLPLPPGSVSLRCR